MSEHYFGPLDEDELAERLRTDIVFAVEYDRAVRDADNDPAPADPKGDEE